MKVCTDDGRFGFVISADSDNKMFGFALIINGRVVGDGEPCFLGTAMRRLGSLRDLDDARLSRVRDDPAEVLSALLSDDDLHDLTVLAIAESLDDWLICGFMHEGEVIFLAQEYEGDELTGPVLMSAVASSEYNAIFEAVHQFWQTRI